MAGLWIPRGFQKPAFGARVNWHHPISAGLIRAYHFNDVTPGQVMTDLAYGQDTLTNSRVMADTRVVSSDQGLVYEAGASSPADRIMSARSIDVNTSTTIVCEYKHHTTNGFLAVDTVLFATDIVPAYGMRLIAKNGVTLEFTAVREAIGSWGTTLTTTFTAGAWNQIAARYSRNTSIADYRGTWRVKCDGVWSTANNEAILAGFGGTFDEGTYSIQAYRSGHPGAFDSNHLFWNYHYIWGRALTDDEIASVQAEPYQMFIR